MDYIDILKGTQEKCNAFDHAAARTPEAFLNMTVNDMNSNEQ